MKNFYDFLKIINEAPQAAPATDAPKPPEGSSPAQSAPAGLGSTPNLGGGLGGGLGSAPPSIGGPAGMPDMSLGGPSPDLGGSPQAPVKSTVIKPVSVWTALEKFILAARKPSSL